MALRFKSVDRHYVWLPWGKEEMIGRVSIFLATGFQNLISTNYCSFGVFLCCLLLVRNSIFCILSENTGPNEHKDCRNISLGGSEIKYGCWG